MLAEIWKKKGRKLFSKILDKVKKLLGAYILVLLILLPGFFMDITYHGVISWPLMMEFMNSIKTLGHELNISYNKLFDFLEKNFGILVTSISIMISLGTNIANRDENKIYGISRQNLNWGFNPNVYRLCTRAVFLAPPAMLITINMSYCFTGYMILFWCYFYVCYSYFMFHNSFSIERDREKLAEKLVSLSLLQDSEQITSQQTLLESIRSSVEKDGNWASIELLYGVIINRCKTIDERKGFRLVYQFFYKVFCQDTVGIRCGEEYLKKQVLKLRQKNIFNNNEYISLWAMLCCIFMNLKEENILRLLKWSINLPQMHTNSEYCIDYLELENYRKWMGLLLFQLEHWLMKNEIKDEKIIKMLPTIWKYGIEIFDNEFLDIRNSCRRLGEIAERNQWEIISIDKDIKKLEEDYEFGYGKSIVYNLICEMEENM